MMVMNKTMEPNANHVVNSVNLNNEDKNRDFNPSVLGREFVRQYYTMLNEGPQNLFRYVFLNFIFFFKFQLINN